MRWTLAALTCGEWAAEVLEAALFMMSSVVMVALIVGMEIYSLRVAVLVRLSLFGATRRAGNMLEASGGVIVARVIMFVGNLIVDRARVKEKAMVTLAVTVARPAFLCAGWQRPPGKAAVRTSAVTRWACAACRATVVALGLASVATAISAAAAADRT